jgi:hypothetical protein
MYAYERFDNILKSFVRNRAYLEGSVVQEYHIDEVVEWALNYADLSNSIGVPKSHHKGRLIEKGTIGKKVITLDPYLFRYAHFHVLKYMSIVSKYLNEHKEVLFRYNPRHNELCLANEHMRKFIGRLQDQISQSSDTQTSVFLKKLAHDPIYSLL